jgi:hypothetical protein|uniref:Uncharacterized protein n=1 Tax=uncultured virus TaxID=340016 RepID=D5L2K0_9VIRU|nr:hypothetical protein [uncultured virus]
MPTEATCEDLDTLKWELRSKKDEFVDAVYGAFRENEWTYRGKGVPDEIQVKATVDLHIQNVSEPDEVGSISYSRSGHIMVMVHKVSEDKLTGRILLEPTRPARTH